MTAPLARPAIFGLFDGIVSCLGILLGLAARPSLILPAAAGIGAAETVGMAAGEWLSESKNGLAASVVIGACTGLGSVIPALPYAVMPGWYARGWSAGLILALTAVIAWKRHQQGRRSLPLAAAESYGVLLAAAAAVAACVSLAPGGPA